MSQHLQPHGHRSSVSQHSRSISQYMSGSEVDELTDEELVKKVNDLKRVIRILTIENEILEKAILRLEPSLLHGVQQALEYAFKLQSNSSMNLGSFAKSQSKFFDSQTSPSRLFPMSSPSRVSTSRRVESSAKISGTIIIGAGPRINVLERSELVAAEVQILIHQLEKARNKAAKQHALLRAQLEEVGERETDIQKATEMFNQEVIVEGWDKIAQRIPAEIWIRFMTEWVKTCDSKIGKLRLRTSTLNTQFSKFKGQIKVKGELSESLRPVDFEKLKIENGVCLEVIDQKLVQLAELKKMAGDANLNLTIHKKALMEQNNYLTGITRTIANKLRLTVDLDKETTVISEQADALAEKLEDIKKVRLKYEVPDILDYVKVKSELADLKHVVKLLENRAHVQQIALKSLNRKLNSMFFS